jgi:hypothetical protein
VIFDLGVISKILVKEAKDKWKRKEFSDFEYLKVPLPTWSYVLIFSLSTIVTVISFLIAIKNDFDKDGKRNKFGRYNFNRYRY